VRHRDLLSLDERQTPALQATSATRTHTTVREHPSSALLAVSAGRYGRVADELPTLQLSPKHLHVLGDHVISEPDDQHLHSVRCCDHRENPRNRHPGLGTMPWVGESGAAAQSARRERRLSRLFRLFDVDDGDELG